MRGGGGWMRRGCGWAGRRASYRVRTPPLAPENPMITRRTVNVELAFQGTGAVVEAGPGHFVGGVPEPDLAGAVSLHVWREARDVSGDWNPVLGEGPYHGGL